LTDDESDSEAFNRFLGASDQYDTDLKVYRQSANFMLKLSELIYNHALQISVRRSIHERAPHPLGRLGSSV